jgi:8-oxo-dGTP diphosphatase
MIDRHTFSVVEFSGAKGIVFLGEHMLVYRRDTKTNNFPLRIDLPGGGREGNETPFETFQREVGEEFGLKVREEEVVYSCSVPSVMNPDTVSFFLFARTTRFVPEDVVFGNEGVEWMLMSPNEFVQRRDGIEWQQERVARYLRDLT